VARIRLTVAAALSAAAAASAQTGANVLLVVNGNDHGSREIAAYYRPRRAVPVRNVCAIRTNPDEEISWDVYVREIDTPIAACL